MLEHDIDDCTGANIIPFAPKPSVRAAPQAYEGLPGFATKIAVALSSPEVAERSMAAVPHTLIQNSSANCVGIKCGLGGRERR